MATYTRAGVFSGTVPGAPRETALRVLDAAGSDAVLWATADKQKTVGPVVYENEAGTVTFYADPGTYTVRWTGGSTTVTVAGGTEEPSAVPSAASLASMLGLLTSGEEVVPRQWCASEYPIDTGTVHLTYFTARKTEVITQVASSVYGTAAATVTTARMGVYQSDGTTASLVAATANDTGLWAATFTTYTRALSAPWYKVAGHRYAYAAFAVASTTPVLGCQQYRYQDAARAPREQGELSGQTNLPATITEASLAAGYRRFQGVFIP